jgi:hypothetical protein
LKPSTLEIGGETVKEKLIVYGPKEELSIMYHKEKHLFRVDMGEELLTNPTSHHLYLQMESHSEKMEASSWSWQLWLLVKRAVFV